MNSNKLASGKAGAVQTDIAPVIKSLRISRWPILEVFPSRRCRQWTAVSARAEPGRKVRPNGFSKKTVLTETPKIDVRIPRDREGTFDPKLIQRYQRRFPGFDDKIVSMYARAMTVREIQGHLLELYGLEVSPDLISTVTGRGARDSR